LDNATTSFEDVEVSECPLFMDTSPTFKVLDPALVIRTHETISPIYLLRFKLGLL
jgi:hypothetical protein